MGPAATLPTCGGVSNREPFARPNDRYTLSFHVLFFALAAPLARDWRGHFPWGPQVNGALPLCAPPRRWSHICRTSGTFFEAPLSLPDAPAISPMLHEDGASGSAHAHASSVASAAAADCGGNTGALDTGEAMDAAHCETCAMCQTCHTVAVLQPAGLPTVPQISPRSPSAAMHRFASAERALFLKPPIS
jgi:hypothetical protein